MKGLHCHLSRKMFEFLIWELFLVLEWFVSFAVYESSLFFCCVLVKYVKHRIHLAQRKIEVTCLRTNGIETTKRIQMPTLPRFVVLKSNHNNKYLHDIHEEKEKVRPWYPHLLNLITRLRVEWNHDLRAYLQAPNKLLSCLTFTISPSLSELQEASISTRAFSIATPWSGWLHITEDCQV